MSKDFFTEQEKKQIVDSVKTAELNTSGEIRVHVEGKCKGEVLDRASNVFAALKMHKTELRNGVLFYLSTVDHKFAILGDGGINKVVADNFWESTKEKMQEHFRSGDFATGLSEGILSAGEQLKAHFPYQSDDVNELDDEISFGDA
ncbi:MAG: TPM domain-containing protein [Flavobacteriales bacterium]|nr:TPM domain-containing protein [Flavobacteriales bacterium]